LLGSRWAGPFSPGACDEPGLKVFLILGRKEAETIVDFGHRPKPYSVVVLVVHRNIFKEEEKTLLQNGDIRKATHLKVRTSESDPMNVQIRFGHQKEVIITLNSVKVWRPIRTFLKAHKVHFPMS